MAGKIRARDDFVSAAVFMAGGAWMAVDLNALGSGAQEAVGVWVPIAWLYGHFGFALAAGALPALGLAFAASGLAKLCNAGKGNGAKT